MKLTIAALAGLSLAGASAAFAAPAASDGEGLFQTRCVMCHGTGVGGAPRTTDEQPVVADDWATGAAGGTDDEGASVLETPPLVLAIVFGFFLVVTLGTDWVRGREGGGKGGGEGGEHKGAPQPIGLFASRGSAQGVGGWRAANGAHGAGTRSVHSALRCAGS